MIEGNVRASTWSARGGAREVSEWPWVLPRVVGLSPRALRTLWHRGDPRRGPPSRVAPPPRARPPRWPLPRGLRRSRERGPGPLLRRAAEGRRRAVQRRGRRWGPPPQAGGRCRGCPCRAPEVCPRGFSGSRGRRATLARTRPRGACAGGRSPRIRQGRPPCSWRRRRGAPWGSLRRTPG